MGSLPLAPQLGDQSGINAHRFWIPTRHRSVNIRPLRVAILGSGGVGGLVGAALARVGDEVLVLARAATAKTLAQQGLEVRSKRFGNFHVALRSAPDLNEQVDVCFITVKAHDLEAALERVQPESIGNALVVPLLNGIEHIDLLRSRYPRGRVVAATMRVESDRPEPGLILQTSPFALIELAPTESTSDDVERLSEHLKLAGFDVRIRDDEATMLWEKLAFLAPLALLTTLDRADAAHVRTARRSEASAMMGEIASVAKADRASVDQGALLKLLDSIPATMTTSMSRDAVAGHKLELDAIGGAIVRRAQKAGIAAPVTARLVAELRTREEGHQGTARRMASPGTAG